MKNIDFKQVAIYGGLALLAYKLFNTKVSISSGLTASNSGVKTPSPSGINLTVTGGGLGSSTAPVSTATPTNNSVPDKVVSTPGPVSTSPVNSLSPYMGIAPGLNDINNQVVNVVW